jgi:hypothetical protein
MKQTDTPISWVFFKAACFGLLGMRLWNKFRLLIKLIIFVRFEIFQNPFICQVILIGIILSVCVCVFAIFTSPKQEHNWLKGGLMRFVLYEYCCSPLNSLIFFQIIKNSLFIIIFLLSSSSSYMLALQLKYKSNNGLNF